MKKIYTFALGFALALSSYGQITLLPSENIQQAIQSNFLGNGIFTSNVTFNGQANVTSSPLMSAFQDANPLLGVSSGIVLSTGMVEDLLTSSIGGTEPYSIQDEDIIQLLQDPLYIGEVTSLEFDFIATGDSVAFQYVFASVEYPEFVNTSFNDHFGFFISGPGINGTFTNGAVNLAYLPNSETAVGINTVNDQTNSEYYNVSANEMGITSIDGFTDVLHACIGQLIVGETYHIKLIIADVGDSALSSHVFLSGESFEQYCSANTEDGANGIQTQNCMLSTLDARVDYTLDCGTITLTNSSLINMNVTNCYYRMGDGNTIPACDADATYTFENPGNYDIQLVYEMNGFESVFFIDDLLISEFPPVTPIISYDNGTFTLTNHDANSSIQWTLNGQPVDGANEITFTPTESGAYAVVVNNGCPSISENLSVVSVGQELELVEMLVYPNPSNGVANINAPATCDRVEVLDATGRLVENIRLNGSQFLQMQLPSGFYLIRALNQNGDVLMTQSHISK
ncbi:MAG: choice-of-anchor L domain-containing protein [Flavobacteriales bacterium]|jgi:hypothetical protein